MVEVGADDGGQLDQHVGFGEVEVGLVGSERAPHQPRAGGGVEPVDQRLVPWPNHRRGVDTGLHGDEVAPPGSRSAMN